ncbi:Nicotinate-nucleotide adenylyltransferase [Serratia symbiotica]|nr:Nicotinate-nucleotide adenylyltransferase [Serratia symbiotica]
MVHNMTIASGIQAFFGGTFDPIHYGHLRAVEALAVELGLDHITLLPNYLPLHRPKSAANDQQRRKMVELAIIGNPLFKIDDRELQRASPSYTIDTLEAVRTEGGMIMPLAFILGQDSLLTLNKWQRWQSLLDYCHLLVLARPGYPDPLNTPDLQQWLECHRVTTADLLSQQANGYIYLANTPELEISATEIRQRYRQGLSCDHFLPHSVHRYIKLQGLYL